MEQYRPLSDSEMLTDPDGEYVKIAEVLAWIEASHNLGYIDKADELISSFKAYIKRLNEESK